MSNSSPTTACHRDVSAISTSLDKSDTIIIIIIATIFINDSRDSREKNKYHGIRNTKNVQLLSCALSQKTNYEIIY